MRVTTCLLLLALAAPAAAFLNRGAECDRAGTPSMVYPDFECNSIAFGNVSNTVELYCRYMDAADTTATCEPAAVEGDYCRRGNIESCPREMFCNASSVCVPRLTVGEVCGRVGAESSQAASEHEGIDGTFSCAEDLFCLFADHDDDTGICTARKAVGSPCDGDHGHHWECADGYCDSISEECRAWKEYDAQCVNTYECGGTDGVGPSREAWNPYGNGYCLGGKCKTAEGQLGELVDAVKSALTIGLGIVVAIVVVSLLACIVIIWCCCCRRKN